MEKSLRLSVHQLVDFLLRSGDIDNRVFNRSSMSEGSRLHSVYQSKQSSNYMSEFPLSINITVDERMVSSKEVMVLMSLMKLKQPWKS